MLFLKPFRAAEVSDVVNAETSSYIFLWKQWDWISWRYLHIMPATEWQKMQKGGKQRNRIKMQIWKSKPVQYFPVCNQYPNSDQGIQGSRVFGLCNINSYWYVNANNISIWRAKIIRQQIHKFKSLKKTAYYPSPCYFLYALCNFVTYNKYGHDYSKSRLVRISDPHCTPTILILISNTRGWVITILRMFNDQFDLKPSGQFLTRKFCTSLEKIRWKKNRR